MLHAGSESTLLLESSPGGLQDCFDIWLPTFSIYLLRYDGIQTQNISSKLLNSFLSAVSVWSYLWSLVERNSRSGGSMKIHEHLNLIVTLTERCLWDTGPNGKDLVFIFIFQIKNKREQNQTISPAPGWGEEDHLCLGVPVPRLLWVRGQPDLSLLPLEEHAFAHSKETATTCWA